MHIPAGGMNMRFYRNTVVILLLWSLFVTLPISAVSLSPGSSFAGAPTIANGDPVYIHGIATGQPGAGLQVWLIGYNYVKISTVFTHADNTYEYELKPADTQSLAPGQYCPGPAPDDERYVRYLL